MRKRCTKCGEEGEFSKNKRTKSGLQSICKLCAKKYQIENAEKLAAYRKKYRIENGDRCRALEKAWRENRSEEKIALDKAKDRAKGKTQRYRDRNRDWRLRTKYGITLSDAGDMLLAQNGQCAICGKDMILRGRKRDVSRIAHIDHNHKTGKVRGLLCQKCNSGIGMLGDSIENLIAAVEYFFVYDNIEN